MNIKSKLIDYTIAEKFLDYIEKQRITKMSVADGIQLSRFHVGEVLNGNRPLSESLRTKLNAYLGTDY